jgi:hypothetical protein
MRQKILYDNDAVFMDCLVTWKVLFTWIWDFASLLFVFCITWGMFSVYIAGMSDTCMHVLYYNFFFSESLYLSYQCAS